VRAADLVELARLKHWLKSVFILIPAPFAIAAGAELRPLAFAVGLLGFSLLASAVYALNDILDAPADRCHPLKRERPVASGRVSPAAAGLLSAGLTIAGLGLLAPTGTLGPYWIGGAFLALNLAYSLGIKRVPLLDVFALASGYLLRVVLGCVLLGVAPSNWLLLCSSTLALLLALGKRRADLMADLDPEHRPSLAGYDQTFLEQAIGIAAGVALVSYALYCLDAEVLLPGREFASLPFVAFGILEYLRRVHTRGEGGSPVDLLLSSPAMAVSGAGWLVAVLWSMGFI
jgi:4-hydroxybenzoate polyprenyltransferase